MGSNARSKAIGTQRHMDPRGCGGVRGRRGEVGGGGGWEGEVGWVVVARVVHVHLKNV